MKRMCGLRSQVHPRSPVMIQTLWCLSQIHFGCMLFQYLHTEVFMFTKQNFLINFKRYRNCWLVQKKCSFVYTGDKFCVHKEKIHIWQINRSCPGLLRYLHNIDMFQRNRPTLGSYVLQNSTHLYIGASLQYWANVMSGFATNISNYAPIEHVEYCTVHALGCWSENFVPIDIVIWVFDVVFFHHINVVCSRSHELRRYYFCVWMICRHKLHHSVSQFYFNHDT